MHFKIHHRFTRPIACILMALLAACAAAAPRNARPAKEDRQEDLTVRVLLVDDQPTASLTSTVDLHIQDGGPARRLPPGTWILTIQDATPPAQRFHLFAKTFPLAERAAAQAYVREWQEKGMTPEIVSFGKRLQAGDKRFLDNRVLWISLIQCKTLSDAEQQRKDLEKQSVWPWIQAETVEPGKGTLVIEDKSAQPALEMSLPAHIHSDTPLVIGGGDYGFWQERREDRTYNGPFQVSVGSHGRLTVIETADIETYLCGVLPAEMPPGWPIEALKAQAVAARSEVLAGMNGRYALEGFDYWATERSRAYLGAGGRHPATDTAVQATAGQVLTDGSRIVPAVFSATCGGWTEDNDTVWSGPPDAQLRAVSDVVVSGDNPAHKPQEQGLANWLLRPPKAHCSGDTTYFRWRKTLSQKELTASVNKRHRVGQVRDIRLGDRGPGGRLKWVRVIGSEDSVVIRKELPIRLAFNGLPSAMFIVDCGKGGDGQTRFTFIGGGRGHGVGLCQYGARGMAAQGASYNSILRHYFTAARIERVLIHGPDSNP